MVNISAPYLSDVEKGRKCAFLLGKLKLLARVLMLSEEDE
jgi:hypothetical protein